MDRKRVVLAITAAILAIAAVAWSASRSLGEPQVSVGNIPPGPNARTEDAPDH